MHRGIAFEESLYQPYREPSGLPLGHVAVEAYQRVWLQHGQAPETILDAIHVNRQKLLPSPIGNERHAAQRLLQVDHATHFRNPAEPCGETFGTTTRRQAFVLTPHEDDIDRSVAHSGVSRHRDMTSATGATVRFQSNREASA